MRKVKFLVVMAIVLSCAGGVWAAAGDVLIGNSTGAYYSITSSYGISYSVGYGDVAGISVLPDGKVAIGSSSNQGIWEYSSSDPTSWSYLGSTIGTVGAVPLTKMPAKSSGNIIWGDGSGILYGVNSSLGGFSYLNLGLGTPIAAMATTANGNVSFGWAGVASAATGMLPLGYLGGAGGYGTVSSMTDLGSGIAFGTTTGVVYVTTPTGGYIVGAGGWGGNISAIAGLDNGKLAFATSGGAVFVTDASLNYLGSQAGLGSITAMTALPGGKFAVGNAGGAVYWLNSSAGIDHYEIGLGNITAMAAGVPEPATIALLSLGLLGLRRKNSK